MPALQKVRAVELATRFTWGIREWITLLMIPAVFGIGYVTYAIGLESTWQSFADTTFRVLCFILLALMHRKMLAAHWKAFASSKLFSILLVIGGAIAMQVAISVVKAFLPAASDSTNAAGAEALTSITPMLVYLLLGPLAIVLVEEFVFRHTLLVELPVWKNKFVAVLVILLNGVLFGLIHFNNFGGVIMLTIPYMVVGVLFCLVYLWTRNIWHVMLMHFLNNFVLTYGGLAALAILQGLGAV